MTKPHTAFLCLLIVGGALACKSDGRSATASADSVHADSIARARQDSVNRAQPGYIVDSIHTPEEDLRRFRAALPGESAKALAGGSSTREALVRRFVTAVAANDTTALLSMVVGAREFGDLYYPESPYSHPPYQQPAGIAWRLIQDPSSAGLTKLIRRLGGQPMSFVSEKCDPKVLHEGRTTRYAGCLVRVVGAAGDTVTKRYYGSIIERDGQFKFLSYTNDF
ncbi:MAG: hypothetical protein JWM95_1526 [Gemmatimonadetes bacterium]|nr:hypothetical protein [Gemmatimonadota bacterium]